MINKDEIKKKYKQTLTPMGVFQIKNIVNGKIFIGSNKNLTARKNRFDMEFSFETMTDEILLNDLRQYGKEKFLFEVLDYLEPKEDPAYNYTDDLKTLEELWIEKLQPFNERGYNKQSNKG
ncbi:MAG: GIY-YIG nuclease family protein [Ignavibacteriaceae bacterium]|nr:GIY-YIG nuclease family protein [Ignavibacteriaceae bacterium]